MLFLASPFAEMVSSMLPRASATSTETVGTLLTAVTGSVGTVVPDLTVYLAVGVVIAGLGMLVRRVISAAR